jgi:DNA-binding beta-propeller fold protein YncE
MDSKGRLFVADRGNNRIQIFDGDGKFIAQWHQFGRPSGIFISKDDTLYSVDSQSDEKTNPGVKRGIRIGSAKDGTVKAFIPDTSSDPQIALAEGVSAVPGGDIVYAAGVSSMGLHKFVKK